LKWVNEDSLKEMKNPKFLIEKESLDDGINAAVDIELCDNMEQYTPAWHGHCMMHMVQKIVCHAISR